MKSSVVYAAILFTHVCKIWDNDLTENPTSSPGLFPQKMTGRRSETFEDYIFSLPRISTKDFPYVKEKIDWSIGINYKSDDFKWTQVFLCCQSFDRRCKWIFSKVRVIQDKSKPTRVAMIWLRVKVNRTRLCTAVHFARNKISEESRKRTFPVQTLCMYDSLFVIYIAL